jgi:hypothetical protein
VTAIFTGSWMKCVPAFIGKCLWLQEERLRISAKLFVISMMGLTLEAKKNNNLTKTVRAFIVFYS